MASLPRLRYPSAAVPPLHHERIGPAAALGDGTIDTFPDVREDGWVLSLPLSPFALLVLGVLFGGLGVYTLVRATPVLLETGDGALVLLVVIGVLFLGLAVSALMWIRRLRAQGLGWMSAVTRDDA